MKEIDIQSQLVNAAFEIGGYGQKLSNGFLAGVPDLVIKIPHFHTCILEVKFVKAKDVPKLPTTNMPKSPTALQYSRLRAMDAGGIFCGWALVAATTDYHNPYSIWIGGCMDPVPNVSLFRDECLYKKRGEPWPLGPMLDQLNKRIANE